MNPQQPGPAGPLPPPPQYTPPAVPQPAIPGVPLPPPPPGTPQDPYGFIMDPPKAPKSVRSGGGISQNPFVMKLLLFAGGAIALMVVAGFLINVFTGDKTNIADMLTIAEQQQEIIRVSGKITDATAQSTKNAAAGTEATVTSQQQDMFLYLAQHGHKKIPAKELALKQDKTTDARLTQAKATSTFDVVFRQVMRAQLESYATSLKDAHAKSGSTKEKTLLAKDYNEVQVLLEQWPDTAAAPPAGQ